MNLVSKVHENTREFLLSQPKDNRKKIGQFFTDEKTAIFMAKMFDFSNVYSKIRVLDPGAGTGILSAAFIEMAREENIKEIELVLVENNKDVLILLEENIKLFSTLSDIVVTVVLNKENFIIEQSAAFSMNALTKYGRFDYVICNPPYLKIARSSKETIGMDSIISGAPNLYFLFMALSAHDLVDGGEMVFIIPRSWTSGAYFKKFREYIFEVAILNKVHLFTSRNKVFSIEKVLQETIIVKFTKGNKEKRQDVPLTTSDDNTFLNMEMLNISYDTIVHGVNKYVYLPASKRQGELLRKIDKFKYTLPQLGMKLKTGLTVDFKNKDRLKRKPTPETTPLVFSSHFSNGRIVFPIKKEPYQFVLATDGMKQENKDYLFIKRLTSKEENRRLQPAIYLKDDIDSHYISTDNKLNFIERINKESLSRDVLYGLYVIFSSSYYDEYYRILNGSTQVNATEINDMPIPNIDGLEQLGRQFKKCKQYSQQVGDEFIESLEG